MGVVPVAQAAPGRLLQEGRPPQRVFLHSSQRAALAKGLSSLRPRGLCAKAQEPPPRVTTGGTLCEWPLTVHWLPTPAKLNAWVAAARQRGLLRPGGRIPSYMH